MQNIDIGRVGGGLEESIFHKIISVENLFKAWKEFRHGKRNKRDVMLFEANLEDRIFDLHNRLCNGQYVHGPYTPFYITDPKLRHIHKATVDDRLVHQAVFRILYPIFDRYFVHDSYSCRNEKGLHKGVYRLEKFARQESINYKRGVCCLKCDIKKFFRSIDHAILKKLIIKRVACQQTLLLLDQIINSFGEEKGIPLGNVTSQIFANIYLNELDHFVRDKLGVKKYIRYCDDFIFIHSDHSILQSYIPKIQHYLQSELLLDLHPRKIIIRKLRQGIDFLGYVALPYHRKLRTRTKRRMIKNIARDGNEAQRQSYLGLLKHANTFNLRRKIKMVKSLRQVL